MDPGKCTLKISKLNTARPTSWQVIYILPCSSQHKRRCSGTKICADLGPQKVATTSLANHIGKLQISSPTSQKIYKNLLSIRFCPKNPGRFRASRPSAPKNNNNLPNSCPTLTSGPATGTPSAQELGRLKRFLGDLMVRDCLLPECTIDLTGISVVTQPSNMLTSTIEWWISP